MNDRHHSDYEIVVGLEVHAQLLCKSKLFSSDDTTFGADPNTQISPVTLGYPGSLPRLNKKAVELAIRTGLACGCSITEKNFFARKNYFYPDLPKGYQLSQHSSAICMGGSLAINTSTGTKNVRLNHIHLEEDAGKSIHDADPEKTCVDFNRAGVPLIEIVTEPVISSGEEAYQFLTELRKLLRYLAVCDGNMEEGSMRCDANVSVRKRGDVQLGTKVEVKNLNSIRHVKKAIEFEGDRMIALLSAGEKIVQQTRSFDAETGTTFALRTKEEANDYRYFADPDLAPFLVSSEFLAEIKESLPALPEKRVKRYTTSLGLSEYDARVLTEEREFSDFFDQIILHTTNYKAAANWMLGPVKSYLNENRLSISLFPLSPQTIANLITLIDEGKLSFSAGSGIVLAELLKRPNDDPWSIAVEKNLIQDSDSGAISQWVDEVLKRMPEKVAEYRKGKKGLLGLFVGEVKKVSRGKADPRITNEILIKKLEYEI